MSYVLLYFTGFMIGISGALIPGTLTLFTAASVLKKNWRVGIKIISGHIIIEGILIGLILLGISSFLNSRKIMSLYSLIGSAALVSMGLLLIFKSRQMSLKQIGQPRQFSQNMVLGGAVFSLLSPGFLIWWITIGAATVIKSALTGLTSVIILTLGHWTADLLWYTGLSYAVEKGKPYLTDKSYRNTVRISGLVLVLLGIKFFLV